MSVAIATLCGCVVGVGLANLTWFRHTRSLRKHVRLLKSQAHAAERLILTAEDMAEQWKKVAMTAQAEADSQRHEREVAQRRLTLVRDNMHRERER